uniref:DNA-directed RNA polymerase n=1 Tax=Rodentolepis nana TaxID=102285 RepID=A0A0R3TRL6_RODNA
LLDYYSLNSISYCYGFGKIEGKNMLFRRNRAVHTDSGNCNMRQFLKTVLESGVENGLSGGSGEVLGHGNRSTGL